MIAIGAQSCPDEPENVQIERFFVERGQRRAFANMLEDPSLDLVRVFLLLSFYMFGACRRNAAFMYLGVAARAAVALGLHVDSSGSLDRDEQKERQEACLGRYEMNPTDFKQNQTLDEPLRDRSPGELDSRPTRCYCRTASRKPQRP